MTSNTASYPKSIEAVPYRWRNLEQTVKNGKKQGGKTAFMQSPAGGYADVMVFEPDNEDWWDVVPSDVVIRAAIRGPANNGNDLIAWALPLANQPTETQQRIKERKPEIEVVIEKKLEKTDPLTKQHVARMQRLVLQGEWLEKHEQQLKVVQSAICNAIFDWYDDDSDDCDGTALNRMLDALHLMIDIGRDLRQSCFCPDSNHDGILYYHGPKDSITEVVNLNKGAEE